MKYDDFIELVKTRRSIRRFKPDPIPDGYVEKLLEAGRWAMSGGNGQPWEFIVVRKQETKDKIAELFAGVQEKYWDIEKTRVPELRHVPYSEPPKGTPGFKDAPILIVVCGDPRTLQVSVLAAPYLSSEGGPTAVFSKNIANATQNIHLAATALGLGSQWFSVNYPWEGHVKALLDVPDELRILCMVAVGYPAYKPPPGYRRELDEIVHYEKYDRSKYRSGDDIYNFILYLRQRGREAYMRWWH